MFEHNETKRRMLNEIILSNESEFGENSAEPMDFDELTDVNYKSCFVCENVNTASMKENEKYFKLMKLYTENASSITKDALFKLIKTYFDTEISPELSLLGVDHEWTLECIKEHFLSHTTFPSDEILTQLRLKRSIRNHLASYCVEKTLDGKLRFNANNIKLLNAIDKDIQLLLKSKNEIQNMVGYNETLDF